MNDDIIIKVENLNKTFKLYQSPKHRLLEALHPLRKKYHHEYQALKNISFEIKRGESIGIIGKNGAGKSTLLKILTGVLTPTSGSVVVNGQVAALLELGSGFNPDLSGMDNIFFQGAIIGFTQEEMRRKVPEIVEFADIGEFINQPVKTYSSGMFARLAFSIAINVDPAILIVDEALSVGDAFFQAKCILKMREMLSKKNLTLFFVSHSITAVRNLCSRAILLKDGSLLKIGSAGEVSELYFEQNSKLANEDADAELEAPSKQTDAFDKLANYRRIQTNEARFSNVTLTNEAGKKLGVVNYGETVNLLFEIDVLEDIENVAFGFHIRNQDGIELLFSSSGVDVDFLNDLKKGMKIKIRNRFFLNLIQGSYTIAVVLSRPIDLNQGIAEYIDFIPIACQFEMLKREPIPIFALVGVTNTTSIQYQ